VESPGRAEGDQRLLEASDSGRWIGENRRSSEKRLLSGENALVCGLRLVLDSDGRWISAGEEGDEGKGDEVERGMVLRDGIGGGGCDSLARACTGCQSQSIFNVIGRLRTRCRGVYTIAELFQQLTTQTC
jgi:hypothetical protein